MHVSDTKWHSLLGAGTHENGAEDLVYKHQYALSGNLNFG